MWKPKFLIVSLTKQMASNYWLPVHKAEKELGVPRSELHKMRDSGPAKLGHHFGAGPMTRSRDSYYWHIPRMKRLLTAMQGQATSETSLSSQMSAA